jgi:hypothetical protein
MEKDNKIEKLNEEILKLEECVTNLGLDKLKIEIRN